MTVEYLSKKDLAKQRVLHGIRVGRYKPGQRLLQNEIAGDLGLSSTPVREALTELMSSGLLVHETHRGMRVASLDAVRMREIYVARKAIERETIRLALDHVDDDTLSTLRSLMRKMRRHQSSHHYELLMTADELFHLTIFEASHNPYLIAAIRNLWDAFPRYLIWNIRDRVAQSMAEHEAIFAALEARDPRALIAATDRHLDNSLATILCHIESLPEVHGP
jgi:DNA-binding GntR family transcriptional regulator